MIFVENKEQPSRLTLSELTWMYHSFASREVLQAILTVQLLKVEKYIHIIKVTIHKIYGIIFSEFINKIEASSQST